MAQSGGKRQLPGIKGVDFAGILDGVLYLIEAKDFRGHRIENRKRLESGELAIELRQKVHSSVACMVGFHRTSPNPDHWEPFVEALGDKGKRVKVVLWLEHELPPHPAVRRKALSSIHVKMFNSTLKSIMLFIIWRMCFT